MLTALLAWLDALPDAADLVLIALLCGALALAHWVHHRLERHDARERWRRLARPAPLAGSDDDRGEGR
jgi:hypothetical protein